MSIFEADFYVVRHADKTRAKLEFARQIERAHDLMAFMEAQQQTIDELVVRGLQMINESRALILRMD